MEILNDLTRLQTHGIYLLITGIVIRFIVGRRRFKRRGIGGLQHFNSYLVALILMTIEWLFNFIGMIAILLGILLLLV